MSSFEIVSYGIAAVAYAAVTVMLLTSHPGGARAAWATAATAVSVLWALGIILILLVDAAAASAIAALDALHLFVWTAYMAFWQDPVIAAPRGPVRRWALPGAALAGLWALFASTGIVEHALVQMSVFPSLAAMALMGLLAAERLYRDSHDAQRGALRLLCLSVGVIFAMDLLVYARATWLSTYTGTLWDSRGIVNALVVPGIVLAIKRQAEWQRELFISRQAAFYAVRVLAVGTYLIAIAAVAQLMRAAGGRWGLWLGVLFIMAAIGLLAVLLRSAVLRSRLKVFLAKHFYRNKYDYRDEWLRLTAGLGGTGELRVVAARGLEGLARIIGAAGADLFLLRDERRYEWIVALTAEVAAKPAYPPDHPVVRFLIERNWVIDSEEYLRDPARYDTAFGDASAGALPPHSIILPLDSGDSLLGFVVLSRPSALGALNFEDHDILRTAGRQVAVVLAQALAQEQLAETRQFEAMNKLSAFLMHDLKNVIAQHELIISNSRRCRDKPEFMDDVVTTLRSGVARMRKLLDHLQRAVATQTTGHRADVSKVLAEVRSHCADREPVPQIPQIGGPVWVRIDMDSLASVLTHLIRNAQDATRPGGTVTVELAERPDELQITVRDTGCGMDEAFIRNRLFRPFDTTKGAKGMGIGAYQVREMVRAAGGEVEVSSALGVGTTFVLRVPREAPGTACDESAA